MEKLLPQLRFPEFKGEWEHEKLSKFSTFNPKNNSLPISFVYIDLESVTNGLLVKENIINKDVAPSRAQRILVKEDILFQTVRPYQQNNLFFNKDGDYVASTGYAQIRTKNDRQFLFQFLHTEKFVAEVMLRCTGTSYPAINSAALSEIGISFPSLPEQTKIATFLIAVDEKLSALKQKKILLEQYKKGVMQKIFSQELRFKDDTSTSLGTGSGNDFADWEEKKLGELGKFSAGGDLIKLDYEKEKSGKYIYPIYANGAGEGIYGYATTFQYQANCVTVSGRGNLGFANVRKENFNAIVRLIVIIPKQEVISKFLEEAINNVNFAIESTGVPQLTVPQISAYKIFIPCIKEQTKIANFLSAIDEKINHCQGQIEKATIWKKGLLQQMFV
ncbi:type I restriction enzyme S subunit [Flavobacterium sp. PL11]|uniref:restriction endonuclease subunit S n=1 Tax=Flavobacterium sp. PL11 TaxID=3071717 RepID=UPI002DFE39A3|nr:type I restriction enzyme S subunit [Flavobacterium sp. PL11]